MYLHVNPYFVEPVNGHDSRSFDMDVSLVIQSQGH